MCGSYEHMDKSGVGEKRIREEICLLGCRAEKRDKVYAGWHKKTGTFENPNKNLRNTRKKNLLTVTEPLQLSF